MESLQGALDELKVEKSRMQQAHENQLEEIQRLHSVQGEKSSLLAELQEVGIEYFYMLKNNTRTFLLLLL